PSCTPAQSHCHRVCRTRRRLCTQRHTTASSTDGRSPSTAARGAPHCIARPPKSFIQQWLTRPPHVTSYTQRDSMVRTQLVVSAVKPNRLGPLKGTRPLCLTILVDRFEETQ